MKIRSLSLFAAFSIASALIPLVQVVSFGACHNVDMYGIYQVCDPPAGEQQQAQPPAVVVQPAYVTVPEPDPYAPPTTDSFSSPAPDSTDNDMPHRDLTAVDARLHALHLLLADKQSQNTIASNIADEENRYLNQIEQREQSAADGNGGYLTVAQENALLQQLQNVENEINQNTSNNG